jgi:hypothetical protein
MNKDPRVIKSFLIAASTIPDFIDWKKVSSEITLSEEVIKKFKNYVDWYSIAKYQILSDEFVQTFWEYLKGYIDYVANNPANSSDVKKKYAPNWEEQFPSARKNYYNRIAPEKL